MAMEYNVVILNKKEMFGKIKIFEDYADMGDSIVVIKKTDPMITPFILSAKGLIIEIGGNLSHSAVLVRELGIPCVRLENATTVLKNGQNVRLDVENSKLYVD